MSYKKSLYKLAEKGYCLEWVEELSNKYKIKLPKSCLDLYRGNILLMKKDNYTYLYKLTNIYASNKCIKSLKNTVGYKGAYLILDCILTYNMNFTKNDRLLKNNVIKVFKSKKEISIWLKLKVLLSNIFTILTKKKFYMSNVFKYLIYNFDVMLFIKSILAIGMMFIGIIAIILLLAEIIRLFGV